MRRVGGLCCILIYLFICLFPFPHHNLSYPIFSCPASTEDYYITWLPVNVIFSIFLGYYRHSIYFFVTSILMPSCASKVTYSVPALRTYYIIRVSYLGPIGGCIPPCPFLYFTLCRLYSASHPGCHSSKGYIGAPGEGCGDIKSRNQ